MRRYLSARPIAAVLCAGALLAGTQAAWAGAQKEEYLADSVRSALSAAVADSRPLRPVFANNDEQLGYLRWLAEMSVRMSGKIPQASVRVELIETAYYEAKRAGLDPALVLGLIQVESGFRKYAISVAGAGYADASGNLGVNSNVVSVSGDTLRTTVAITSDKTTFLAGDTSTVTFTFSEEPDGFTKDDESFETHLYYTGGP